MSSKDEVFVLGRRQKKEDLYLEGYGKDWGEKLTFTVGVTYLASGFLGGSYSLLNNFRHRALSNRVDSIWSIGRDTVRFANGGACASLLFCLTGKLIDLVFEEELQDFTHSQKFMISGAVTGAIYKSTLGLKPMVVGSIFGAALLGSVTKILKYLNDKGLVNYRLDF